MRKTLSQPFISAPASSREFEITIATPITKEEIFARLSDLAKEDFALRSSGVKIVPGVECAHTRALAANALATYRLNQMLTAARLSETYPSANHTLH